MEQLSIWRDHEIARSIFNRSCGPGACRASVIHTRAAGSHDGVSRTSAPAAFPAGTIARYRVTYFKSNTSDVNLRTASVISVTNHAPFGVNCTVAVDWKLGTGANACSTSVSVAPGATVDFCSRPVPAGVTTCNSTCPGAGLTAVEGNAAIASTNSTDCARIAVSARTYYTASTTDSPVSAITDAKIVRVGNGNTGD